MLFKIDLDIISNNYYYLIIILLFIFNDKYSKYTDIIIELILSNDIKKLQQLIINNYKQTSEYNKNIIKKTINDFNKSIDIKNYELNKYNPDINSYYLYNIIFFLLQHNNKTNLNNSIELFYKYYSDILYNSNNIDIVKDIDIINKKNRIDNYFKVILFSLLSNTKIFNVLFYNIINDLNILLKHEDYIILKYLYIINYNKVKLINKIINNHDNDSYLINNIIYNIDNPLINLIFNYYIKYLDISSDDNEKKYINNIIKSIIYIFKENKISSKTQEKLDYISLNINKINYLLYNTILLINSINIINISLIDEINDFCKNLITKKYDFFKPKQNTYTEHDKKLGTYEINLLNEKYTFNLSYYIRHIEKFTVDDIKELLIDISSKLNTDELLYLNNIIKEHLKIKHKSPSKYYVKQSNILNILKDFNISDINNYTYNYLLIILIYIYEYYYTKVEIISILPKYIEYINNNELRIKLKKEINDLYSKLNKNQLNKLHIKLSVLNKLLNVEDYNLTYYNNINLDKVNIINIYVYLLYNSNVEINIINNLFNFNNLIKFKYSNNISLNLIEILEYMIENIENIQDRNKIINFILNCIILCFIYRYNKDYLLDNNIYNKLFINIKSIFSSFDYIKYLFIINDDSKFIELYDNIIPENEEDINYLTDRYQNNIYYDIIDELEVNEYINSENEEDYRANKLNFMKFIVFYCIQEYFKYKKTFNKDELNKINTTKDNIVLYLETNDNKYLKILSENKLNYNLFDLLIFPFNINNIHYTNSEYVRKILKIDDVNKYDNITLFNKFCKYIKKEYYKNNIDNKDIINILKNIRDEEDAESISKSLNLSLSSSKGGKLKK